jgi:hypothetical protein
MNRRSLIQLLIGIIATVAGLAALNAIRQDRCLDAGGQWVANARSCVGPDGPLTVARGSDVLAAIVIGVLLAFMLHRASTFARRRSSRP